MARQNLKAGVLTAPLPPVMVTVGDMEKSNIITIGWTGILSTNPPRTYISVRPERYSYGMLVEHGEFVINLTRAEQARIVDYVGIYTGAKVNKFEATGLTAVESKVVSAPTIAECPLSLECRVIERVPSGTHDVFVAEIVNVSVDDEILDAQGRICLDRAGLLAYCHGEYFALGEKLGRFGFSTAKKKTGSSGGASATKTRSADRDKPQSADRTPKNKGADKQAGHRKKNKSTPPFKVKHKGGKK